MDWPEDWDLRVDGTACPLCLEGRPEDTGRALRFYETATVDAYLPRTGVQRGYAVVVWRGSHVVEPTELPEADAVSYWLTVLDVGRAMAQHYAPRKMNYQTLGNATPHLHTFVTCRLVDGDAAPRRPLPADATLYQPFDEELIQADARALRRLLEPDDKQAKQ